MFKQSGAICARLLGSPEENPLAHRSFQSDPRRIRGYRSRIRFDRRIDRSRRNRGLHPRRHQSRYPLQHHRRKALKKALDGRHASSSVTNLPGSAKKGLLTDSLIGGSLLSRLRAALGLAVLVALAIALRLQPILVDPSAVWPDEIFQSAEPAHRLVFGNGLVAWEFQLGVRSWLLPGLVAGLMELSRIIGDGPDYYLPVIAAFFGTLAAGPVVCCFLWCRPLFGLSGALLAALTVALAAEPVYFGARTLSETVAGHLLVVTLWVLEPGYSVTSWRRLFCGGALLALVFVTRVQLAPALAVALLWMSWRADRRRIAAMVAGAAALLGTAATLDTITLGYPFASIWRYVVY